MMLQDPSWLCPSDGDRQRFLDMQHRVRIARIVTIVCGVAVMVALVPTTGWPVLPLGGLMLTSVLIGGASVDHHRRPELRVFFSTILAIQLTVALAVILAGGPRTPLAALLAGPVLMVGTRFSRRGLIVGAPISAALVLITTAGVDPSYVWHHPESAVVPLSLVIMSTAYLSPLVASDVRHRTDSSLDALTGLLNRRGFEARLAEVAAQARLDHRPLSVIAIDVDHLKEVNDKFGHASGDRALQEIADAMRRSLRTFELLYRMGGDEFLLLLPGASSEVAARVADTLRDAVSRAQPLGLSISCSFGIATITGEMDPFLLAEHADSALYSAKRQGRNRIALEPGTPEQLADEASRSTGVRRLSVASARRAALP